jgi:hypothetical protein
MIGGAAALLVTLCGCGDTLGDPCESDSECSDGLTCLSPGCIGDKSCQYACSSDDECASNAGEGSTCNTDDPFGSCVGFCSAAD